MNQAEKEEIDEDEQRLRQMIGQLNNCKAEIFQRDRSIKMMELTCAEIESISKSAGTPAKMYKTVGKMFLQSEPESLLGEFKVAKEKETRNLNILQKTKEHLERNLQENHQAYLHKHKLQTASH